MGRSRKDPQPPHGGNLRCSEGGGVKFTLDVLGCPKGGGGGGSFSISSVGELRIFSGTTQLTLFFFFITDLIFSDFAWPCCTNGWQTKHRN